MHRVNDIVNPTIMGPEDSMYALLGHLRENEPLAYFDDHKHFSLAEFEEQALRTPEARARFAEDCQVVRVSVALSRGARRAGDPPRPAACLRGGSGRGSGSAGAAGRCGAAGRRRPG